MLNETEHPRNRQACNGQKLTTGCSTFPRVLHRLSGNHGVYSMSALGQCEVALHLSECLYCSPCWWPAHTLTPNIIIHSGRFWQRHCKVQSYKYGAFTTIHNLRWGRIQCLNITTHRLPNLFTSEFTFRDNVFQQHCSANSQIED